MLLTYDGKTLKGNEFRGGPLLRTLHTDDGRRLKRNAFGKDHS